jgi:hypothetical protein
MKNKYLEIIDRVDDLVYEFYNESDNSFLKEKPEYRFLLLSTLFADLCPFNLADNNKSFQVLTRESLINTNTLNKSKEICKYINEIVGTPAYFAASYWSPIDRNRHTISHSIQIDKTEQHHYYRCNALLFYILTQKAPPKFHSAINYISENANRKDGLHSSYSRLKENSEKKHSWFNIPNNMHDEMMEVSGFKSIIDSLLSIEESTIKNSLSIIMENLDFDLVSIEFDKYQDTIAKALSNFENFNIPPSLKNEALYFEKYLNYFFNNEDILGSESKKFSLKQAFYMACTHVLYNKACPTNMFYAFPVRVDNTCCFLTLGVESELSVDKMLVFSHIIKSIYHHSLDRDYQSLKALERTRLAQGAVHKIRGPLSVLIEFPYDIIETLSENLTELEFKKVKKPIEEENSKFKISFDNINIGLKSLEKFVDVEEEGNYNIIAIIKNAIKTYSNLKIRILEEISLFGDYQKPVNILCTDSQIQFIFEELISNSLRAFNHYKIYQQRKLRIKINIKVEDNNVIVDFFDNGLGIEINRKKSIFSSGFRGKDSGGSGKGLFLSKLFLNKNRHSIEEIGDFGLGAQFRIVFIKTDKI